MGKFVKNLNLGKCILPLHLTLTLPHTLPIPPKHYCLTKVETVLDLRFDLLSHMDIWGLQKGKHLPRVRHLLNTAPNCHLPTLFPLQPQLKMSYTSMMMMKIITTFMKQLRFSIWKWVKNNNTQFQITSHQKLLLVWPTVYYIKLNIRGKHGVDAGVQFRSTLQESNLIATITINIGFDERSWFSYVDAAWIIMESIIWFSSNLLPQDVPCQQLTES